MIGVDCPECSTPLGAKGTCRHCGWAPAPEVHTSVRPLYREFPERTWESSKPDDVCPECGKKVREHIQEFKRYGQRIQERIGVKA